MKKLDTLACNIIEKINAKMIIIVYLLGLLAWSGCSFGNLDRTAKSPQLNIELNEQKLIVKHGQAELLGYQAQPIANPIGGEKFKGSNFIHPLNTPSGFTLTQLQPEDHFHHFGLWWPWKYIIANGREILCWELQSGEGIVEAKRILKHSTEQDSAVFVAESEYIDRTAPNGPQVVLHERLEVKVTKPVGFSAHGYFVDFTITNRCVAEIPAEIVKYRYSGFSFRGTSVWNKKNSTFLTSEGKNRDTSNFTRAKWVLIQGDTPDAGKAGIILMSHPDNYDHPQLLRTWDSKQYDGAVFVNFNPVQNIAWNFESGKDYVQRYQLFVYDGIVTTDKAEQLWQNYADMVKTK